MTLKKSTIIATDTDLGLCVRLNSHHFNLNTVSDQRFVPVCSHKHPEARVRATPSLRLLAIFWLSPACHLALAHEAQHRICADTYLVGATLLLSCSNAGVKWIHAAARPAALCGACRSRRASDALLLLAQSTLAPQMPATPLLPFPGPSCHLIRRACLYSRHKPLTHREGFTPGIVWGARPSRKEHSTKHLKFFCLHIGEKVKSSQCYPFKIKAYETTDE